MRIIPLTTALALTFSTAAICSADKAPETSQPTTAPADELPQTLVTLHLNNVLPEDAFNELSR